MKTPLSSYLNKKIAVHCNNQEEWDAIGRMRIEEGRKSPSSPNAYKKWDTYGMQENGSWASLQWYKEEGFQIIEASTLLHSLNPINSNYEIF